ncbi:MAG TPA: zinc-binding dehydrogenase, partial [Sphingobium sp.]|nr:zinc-binding dehydrogenase [Sphingobium sp.]
GLAAVQLGKAFGAHVIAGVSSEEKAQAVRDNGADDVIIYPRELDLAAAKAITAAIRLAAGGTVDVIYDPVGGPYAEPALRSLGWDGRYLVVGFPAGIPKIPLNLPLLKSCSIVGVFYGLYIENFPEQHRVEVAELISLWRERRIRPLVSERFSFEESGKAIESLVSRKVVGKAVVLLNG